MCVPGTGLMRLERDETSAGTEKIYLVTYNPEGPTRMLVSLT